MKVNDSEVRPDSKLRGITGYGLRGTGCEMRVASGEMGVKQSGHRWRKREPAGFALPTHRSSAFLRKTCEFFPLGVFDAENFCLSNQSIDP